jgi:hypothetical protein
MNRGDYYRGDYYRGDPNIFGSIFGGLRKAFKVVGGAALGYLTGGGVKGAIAGAIGGTGAAIAEGVREETLGAGGAESALTPELRASHAAALTAHPGGGIIHMAGPPMMVGTGGRGVRRMHPNRSTYVTRGGGTSRWPVGLQVHPKGTEAVPARRMNVANPRALRRGIRRIRGFVKLARKAVRAVGLTIQRSGHKRAKRR